MGNGLIFGFVVALWAAYFVPLAVRRYDEAAKSGSIDKFSTLTRVIGHSDDTSTTQTKPAVADKTATPVVSGPRISRASARVAAKRRRLVLITLLFATAAVGGVAAFEIISIWMITIPVVLLATWLVACRVQVRDERGISAERVPRQKAEKRPKAEKAQPRLGRAPKKRAKTADEEETVILSGQFEDIEPQRKHEMQESSLASDALDDQIVIAVPVGTTSGEALWDPLPVTLPTYVTKPRAGRTVRTIEFGTPSAWTSGHIEGEEVDFPERPDEQPQRRVVGG